jgi:hypothetical protein
MRGCTSGRGISCLRRGAHTTAKSLTVSVGYASGVANSLPRVIADGEIPRISVRWAVASFALALTMTGGRESEGRPRG